MPEHEPPAKPPTEAITRLMGIYRNTGHQVPLGLTNHVERAISARHITIFSPSNLLPSPLQTSEYARAIALESTQGEPASDTLRVDKAIMHELRAATIQAATEQGTAWEVITNAVAVRRALEIEKEARHRESLVGLLAKQALMDVRLIRGLPTHLRVPGAVRAVAIITTQHGEQLVTLETEVDARLVSQPATTQRYIALVGEARSQALHNLESRQLIVDMSEQIRRLE